MPKVALYAGSFDPITNGHADLIRRSLSFVDRLVVGVAVNVAKQPLFSADERMALIRAAVEDDPRVEVRAFRGLVVDFAKEIGVSVVLRGLRAVADFEYEYQMALMNRHLSPGLETMFMVPSVQVSYVSSSLVREVARFGGDIDALVHPAVAKALREKFAGSSPPDPRSAVPMSLQIAMQGDVLVIAVEGPLIVGNRQELKQEVLDRVESGVRKVVIDFAGTAYIDSSGLGVLVSLAKRLRELGGDLRLASLSDDLLTLFELTKLDALFQIAASRARALEGF